MIIRNGSIMEFFEKYVIGYNSEDRRMEGDDSRDLIRKLGAQKIHVRKGSITDGERVEFIFEEYGLNSRIKGSGRVTFIALDHDDISWELQKESESMIGGFEA